MTTEPDAHEILPPPALSYTEQINAYVTAEYEQYALPMPPKWVRHLIDGAAFLATLFYAGLFSRFIIDQIHHQVIEHHFGSFTVTRYENASPWVMILLSAAFLLGPFVLFLAGTYSTRSDANRVIGSLLRQVHYQKDATNWEREWRLRDEERHREQMSILRQPPQQRSYIETLEYLLDEALARQDPEADGG